MFNFKYLVFFYIKFVYINISSYDNEIITEFVFTFKELLPLFFVHLR